MSVPANYEYYMLYNSKTTPSTVHVSNTGLSNYYRRYMLQKLLSVYKFNGIPETWAENYFLYSLFTFGFVAVINTDKYGVIPQHCSLYGYNVMYQPTNVMIANPLINKTLQPKIGSDCALIRMQPDYGSAWDIICHYGDLKALACEAAAVNLINSKLAYVFAAESKSAAESFKKLYDKIANGEPATFIDKGLFDEDGSPRWFEFAQNLKQNYIVSELLQDMAKIDSKFDTEIGIPNVNLAKESGVSQSEIMSNNVETRSKASLWLEEIRKGLQQANDLFNLNLSVDFRFKESEVLNDGNNTID